MEKISNNIYFLFVLTLFIYSFEENSNLNFCIIDNYKLRVHPCNHKLKPEIFLSIYPLHVPFPKTSLNQIPSIIITLFLHTTFPV